MIGKPLTVVVSIAMLAGVHGLLAQQYVISTQAGGTPPPTPVAALTASIGTPSVVAVNGAGQTYFESLNCIFRIETNGALTRVAGNGRPGFSGDGGSALTAQIGHVEGLAVDASGNIYISDTSASRIRRVSPDGIIATIAGVGEFDYSGDGGPGIVAHLRRPSGLAIDAAATS